MPRGKMKFPTGSPNSDLWPDDPEGAMAEIAGRHNAAYIERSLVFAPGGKIAEALFETVEPGDDGPPTNLLGLAADLDAVEAGLFIGPDRWTPGA